MARVKLIAEFTAGVRTPIIGALFLIGPILVVTVVVSLRADRRMARLHTALSEG
jgi:hypothetical protein